MDIHILNAKVVYQKFDAYIDTTALLHNYYLAWLCPVANYVLAVCIYVCVCIAYFVKNKKSLCTQHKLVNTHIKFLSHTHAYVK